MVHDERTEDVTHTPGDVKQHKGWKNVSNIIFDLDETIVVGDVIEKVSRDMLSEGKLDRVYTNSDIHHYDFRELPQELRVKLVDAFSNPESPWMKSPMPGVFYFLRTLEELGHLTGVVTARAKCTMDSTKEFLKKEFEGVNFELGTYTVNQGDVVNTGDMPSKVELLISLATDVYFDDNVEYALSAKRAGISEVYLISNSHTLWNHCVEADDVRIPVLKNPAFYDHHQL